jgi:hypothetical protein
MAIIMLMMYTMQSLLVPVAALQHEMRRDASGKFVHFAKNNLESKSSLVREVCLTRSQLQGPNLKCPKKLAKRKNCIIKQFFQHGLHCRVQRVGEAENPGPIVVSTFNPTQLLGRENDVASFLDGVWTGCETSHTVDAQNVIQSRFKSLQINAVFSAPAEKHSDNKGIYRGKAVGSAVMSRFPLQPYPEALDDDALATCRFSDAIVKLRPDLPMYVCAIYGPPENNTILADSEKVLVAAARPGVERALYFRGPAVITGDMNRELHELPFWPILRRKG